MPKCPSTGWSREGGLVSQGGSLSSKRSHEQGGRGTSPISLLTITAAVHSERCTAPFIHRAQRDTRHLSTMFSTSCLPPSLFFPLYCCLCVYSILPCHCRRSRAGDTHTDTEQCLPHYTATQHCMLVKQPGRGFLLLLLQRTLPRRRSERRSQGA